MKNIENKAILDATPPLIQGGGGGRLFTESSRPLISTREVATFHLDHAPLSRPRFET